MKRHHILGMTLGGLFSLIGLVQPLEAQAPAATFQDLRTRLNLKTEESIEVTEQDGSKYKARVAAITENSIVIMRDGNRRELPESQVREIRHRRPDKWWNGMLIGLGAGAAAGVVGAGAACSNDSECYVNATAALVPAFAVIGMGAGAAIDFAIRKHETVFAQPPSGTSHNLRISPIVGKKTAGVNVSFKF